MIGDLVFAFVAGSVATVNPCGFALLPAYLARRLAVDGGPAGATDAVIGALGAGAVMTFGFLLIFGLGGGAVALGAGWLADTFPWAGLVIGVVMALAGLVILSGRRIGFALALPRPGAPARGHRGDFVFGLGYGTASLSCTLPIFLAVVGTATTGGVLTGALSVGAYALGMGTVVVAVALAAVLSRTGIATALGGLLPYLPRLGGALIFLSGLYVAYFWGDTLFSETLPTADSALAIGERLSGRLSAWLGGAPGQSATLAALVLLLGLAAWALWRRLSAKDRAHAAGRERVSLSRAAEE